MTQTSSDSQNHFTSLLSLSSPLYVTSPSDATTRLSLRQLIPVYGSLCKAVRRDASAPTHDGSHISNVNEAIEALLCKEEWDMCKSLLNSGRDEERLLVIQFLLMNLVGTHDAHPPFTRWMSAFAALVISFLYEHEDVNEEMREAVLDAAFDNPPSMHLDDAECISQHLETSLERIREASCFDSEGRVPSLCAWTVTCRLLTRLSQQTFWTDPQHHRSINLTIQEVCLRSIDICHESHDNLVYLRPITTWLLPQLLEGVGGNDWNHQHIVDILWNRLMELPQSKNTTAAKIILPHKRDNNSIVPLLVASAYLCSLLPSVVEIPLPVSNDAGAVERSRPAQQPVVWYGVIFPLLSSGMNVDLKAGFRAEVGNVDQTLRRRGLYLLRQLVESERKRVESGIFDSSSIIVWTKYILCFEALEMEIEQHLIDQVWDTVAELCWEASSNFKASSRPSESKSPIDEALGVPPPMTWDWIHVMLCRVFLSESPVLRKLGLYRFLNGNAGIQVDVHDVAQKEKGEGASNTVSTNKKGQSTLLQPGRKKHSIKAKDRNLKATKAPLKLVSTGFVLNAVIPAYDTLGPSIGTNIQFEENGKIKAEDITPRSSSFLVAYVHALLQDDAKRLQDFLAGIFSQDIICRLRTKTTLLVFRAVANALTTADVVPSQVVIQQDMIQTAVQSFQLLFGFGSVVVTFRNGLLEALAQILSASRLEGPIDMKTILKALALYPLDLISAKKSNGYTDLSPRSFSENKTYAALQKWLKNLGNGPAWASTAGSACSSAFVSGQLLSSSNAWDPILGASETQRSFGGAIVLMCALVGESKDATNSASSMLWPPIHKGLRCTPSPSLAWVDADKATAAMILLEFGCTLEVLSGMGNGDLVVDRQTQQMMPPPPNIEGILSRGVGFVMNHIRSLIGPNRNAQSPDSNVLVKASGSTRSGDASRISSMITILIGQLKVLKESFPSSSAISSVADELLEESLKVLLDQGRDDIDVVTFTTLSYASLSCGANPLITVDGVSSVDICLRFLRMKFEGNVGGMTKSELQTARSVFHYARWGFLSYELPPLLERTRQRKDKKKLAAFLDELFTAANELVEATPIDALLPLFDTVVVAAGHWLSNDSNLPTYPLTLNKIIDSLFAVMSDVSSSQTSSYMLNEICCLVFRPSLLLDEYIRTAADQDYPAPVQSAFHRLMKMAGTARPHVSRVAICHICAAWLSTANDEDSVPGLSAIPYSKDIARLLVHKEAKIDESSTNQGTLKNEVGVSGGTLQLPPDTNELSTVRGFVILFLSRLPDPGKGLNEKVLKELLHSVVISLLDDVCLAPLTSGSSIMTGTEDYSLRIRAWQALCILSRFVTPEIAAPVCNKVFECMAQNLHGQIRYFVEVFSIQCARAHPVLFGEKYVTEVGRYDISLQHIASLMIIGGNLIVGRYKLDFFRKTTEGSGGVRLREILSGVIPWLSSTQGFSRAIAQLMVHAMIPMVVNVGDDSVGRWDDDWFLRNLYRFLGNNPEMKRLRKKQVKVFNRYDAEKACTPEGLLSIKVDDGFEANPEHVVEAIKKCLEEVYLETHEHEAPMWKQVEALLRASSTDETTTPASVGEEGLVNFQRKIIPLDSLDLALEESREQRLRNAAGRKRQPLIICASLIDKVPNLAGLARTAEIFAAEKLVIPDKNVCRMDNFKSISVSAEDWIEVEECKEDHLLRWLREKREEGYTIVGLEQTSSSISVADVKFPSKTVLLLGKEKEGIPVEFLQFVDECVEIPQLGIIRSLNVHVSGAITIWEYTKQISGNGV